MKRGRCGWGGLSAAEMRKGLGRRWWGGNTWRLKSPLLEKGADAWVGRRLVRDGIRLERGPNSAVRVCWTSIPTARHRTYTTSHAKKEDHKELGAEALKGGAEHSRTARRPSEGQARGRGFAVSRHTPPGVTCACFMASLMRSRVDSMNTPI
jgi:hypothetical protein